MSVDEIHIGDVGTVLEATIKDGDTVVNISSATVKKFKFERPDGSTFEKTASFTTDGSDGKIKYTTEASVLNVVGVWRFQAYLELASGKWSSDIAEFTVFRNITIS